jgi:L-threonylcarbamoyladenylate synthase
VAEIEAHFPEVLTLETSESKIDNTLTMGVPSTVAKWMGNHWKILRQGSVNMGI